MLKIHVVTIVGCFLGAGLGLSVMDGTIDLLEPSVGVVTDILTFGTWCWPISALLSIVLAMKAFKVVPDFKRESVLRVIGVRDVETIESNKENSK